MKSYRQQQGYLLITVVVTLFLLATVAVMLTHGSAINASDASSELESDRAEYVAQAGMQHALWRTSNNACMGNVTIPTTTLGNDNYTASISGASVGTAFTLTADQDAWIRNDDVTKNNGTTTDQHIRFETGKIEQTLTRFDLSSLPADSHIYTAVAWFYLSTAGAGGGAHPEGPLTVHRITEDWTETDATWDTMNGNFDDSRLATISAQPVDGVWVSFNLTGQIQAWVNGQANYGILMQSVAEGVHGKYSSREDGGNAPRLEVVVGSGPASPVAIDVTGTLASGVTRTLNRSTSNNQPPTNALLEPVGDVYLKQDAPTLNHGVGGLWVEDPGAGGTADSSLIKFNFSQIPRGAMVTAATLEVYAYWDLSSGPGSSIGVHRVTRDWVEGTNNGSSGSGATWNESKPGTSWSSAGGDYHPSASAIFDAPPNTTGWHQWDVTALANDWSTGTYANHGLILVAENDTTLKGFRSRDYSDTSQRPKLTITYACECGNACMAPQGSGKVLMPASSSSNPGPEEMLRIELLESWGYVVEPYWANNSQTNWNSKMANFDVVYVPATANPSDIGSKLTNATIGVVYELGALNDELGIATAEASPVGSTINVSDNSHFITQLFKTGPLDMYTADMAGKAVAGTEAPGLQTLGDWGGAGSPVVLDTGAALGGDVSGESAAGRRVLLPMGNNIDLSKVNNNGQLIMQRALAWAMGAGGGGSGNLLLFVGNAGSPSTKDQDRKALFESWGYNISLMDETADEVKLKEAMDSNDVVYVSGTISESALNEKLREYPVGIVNEFAGNLDNFGFGSQVPPNTVTANRFFTTDDTHYVSEPFGGAEVTQFTSNITMPIPSGILAPGMQSPGLIGAAQILVTLDTGAQRWDGTPSTGRRVHLPFGEADVSQLTPDGETLMRRSIEWAAGSGSGLSGDYLDEFNAVAYNGNDGTLVWSGDWQELGESNGPGSSRVSVVSSASQCASGGCLRIGGDEVSLTGRGASRQADLDGASFAELTFTIADSGSGASVKVEASSDGGTNWTTLQTFTAGSGIPSTATSQNFDILAYASADTQIRFIGSGTPDDAAYLYIDNVRIDLNGSSPSLAPIAHWKLDDGAGTIAIDSVGGHDGTLPNGGTWTTGQVDDALQFNGTNHYINVPHDDTLSLSTFSISAWIRPDTVSGYHAIMYKGASTAEANYHLYTDDDEITLGLTSGGWQYQIPSTSANLVAGQWYHLTTTFDGTNGEGKHYLDGSLIHTGTIGPSPVMNTGPLTIGTDPFDEDWVGILDDVRIYDRVLDATEIAELAASGSGGGGGGGGGGPGYNETYEPWSASNNDAWEAADLAPFGVPANAVVEVAVINTDTRTQLWGGVRATGSTLDRRLQLHEAEDGGNDIMVMTVQADASSHIEHYADTASTVTFILLGYWSTGSFVESWDLFDAGASGTWTDHALNTYGVAPGSVTEILVHNRSTTTEVQAGVRSNGSSLDRRFEIHEAEAGGRDMFTLLVDADTDAGATIEVFMEHGGGDFYVMGHWSTPPGVFTESYSELSGSPASSATWDDKDLTSLGVPANAVVQIAMANGQDTAEALLGVRRKGSSIHRTLDLQEAEGGGDDFASTHVNADGSSTIQWYDENTGEDHRFYLLGWWVPN